MSNKVLVRGESISIDMDNPVIRAVDFRVGRGSIDVANATVFESGSATARLQVIKRDYYSSCGFFLTIDLPTYF
jgi:hypothetical protein